MKILLIAIISAILLAHFSFAQESGCDYGVELQFNGTEFENGGFKLKIKAERLDGSPTNITGTLEIKDFNGKTVKLYRIWESEPISKRKTSAEYTPNLTKGESYRIIARIDVKCKDSNEDNNLDTKMIRIIGQAENIINLRGEQKSCGQYSAYESGNEKAARLILIFLLVLSVLLNVVLIWKR